MAIQERLGSDVAMVLDQVVALPDEPSRGPRRRRADHPLGRPLPGRRPRADQALFAIVQGGLDAELRVIVRERLAELDFPGYAIGGLSVGEQPCRDVRRAGRDGPGMPADRPRYLMGVGRPADLLEAIRRGVDLFDCVMPTRCGRNALAFTDQGPRRLRNLQYQDDGRPLEEGCPCAACQRSRGYLRHLFMAHEMLGPILLSIHNVTYYQRLLAGTAKRSPPIVLKPIAWRSCGVGQACDT